VEPRTSPLELLHPDGVAHRVIVLGAGCPDVLRPDRPEPANGEQADLVIIAPSRAELGEANWSQHAVERTAAGLATDGVVYVLCPRGARRRVARLLAARNLRPKLSLFHDPDTNGTRSLVPLSEQLAAYAFTNLIATRPLRRRLFLGALRRRSLAGLIAYALPQIGFVAGHATGRPLWAWLPAGIDAEVQAPMAIVTVGWRGSEGSLVAHGFDGARPQPLVVAKVRRPGGHELDTEASNLRRLAPAARAAGAAVPEPLRVGANADRATLYETPVEGRSAAALVGEAPALAPSVMTRITEWLESWNLDTRSHETLTPEWLEEAITGPTRALVPFLPDGERYVEWLGARCSSLAGKKIPFVASHNDLTMVNVFVTSNGALGVVDWEAALGRDLPLVDFYYAAADAAAAAARYADRPTAFRELFGTDAGADSIARQLERRLVRALELEQELVELAFHACWIRQATAEQTVNARPTDRPFLEILRSVTSSVR
jgi:hypothetical protein